MNSTVITYQHPSNLVSMAYLSRVSNLIHSHFFFFSAQQPVPWAFSRKYDYVSCVCGVWVLQPGARFPAALRPPGACPGGWAFTRSLLAWKGHAWVRGAVQGGQSGSGDPRSHCSARQIPSWAVAWGRGLCEQGESLEHPVSEKVLCSETTASHGPGIVQRKGVNAF